MDTITASKPKSLTLSKLADLLKEADTFARKPFGYDNPPGAMLADLISLPALQKTVERKAYGEPLTSGKGWATRMLPETAEALTALPVPAAKAPKATAIALASMVDPGALERALTVWHGTPHKFSKFDASKIGTGEGAQAYGHGIYTAESRDVANSYAVNLANQDITNQNRLNAHANAQRLAKLAGDPKYAADDIRFVLESNPDHAQAQLLQDTLQHLESGSYAKPLENTGHLYKIDLPDEHIAKMLDWDKPLSEQPFNVREVLKRRLQIVEPTDKFDMGGNALLRDNRKGQYDRSSPHPWMLEANHESGTSKFGLSQKDIDRMFGNKEVKDLTGEQILSQLTQKHGGAPAASKYLMELGIPGIRYLDAGSRGTGGTSNFVIFPGNEHLLNILERNGVAP